MFYGRDVVQVADLIQLQQPSEPSPCLAVLIIDFQHLINSFPTFFVSSIRQSSRQSVTAKPVARLSFINAVKSVFYTAQVARRVCLHFGRESPLFQVDIASPIR
jgi:hypothetical protein